MNKRIRQYAGIYNQTRPLTKQLILSNSHWYKINYRLNQRAYWKMIRLITEKIIKKWEWLNDK